MAGACTRRAQGPAPTSPIRTVVAMLSILPSRSSEVFRLYAQDLPFPDEAFDL